MLLTGDPIDAATAVDWGLVNTAVPAERLDAEVAALAAKILSFSRETIAIGKKTFYAQANLTETAAYQVAGPIMSSNAAAADAQEGMSAFLEKRQPRWRATGV